MTHIEAENKIKELLDKSFLDKLKEISKLYGWSGDYYEISSFVEKLYEFHNVTYDDKDPYDVYD